MIVVSSLKKIEVFMDIKKDNMKGGCCRHGTENKNNCCKQPKQQNPKDQKQPDQSQKTPAGK